MFYIFDCNGRVVGNPRGYRTIRGATREQDRRGSPAWRAIWDAFYARKEKDPDHRNISEIREKELDEGRE